MEDKLLKKLQKKGNWKTLKNKLLLAFTHPHEDPKESDPSEGKEQCTCTL